MNRRRLFAISCVALVTTAMAFSIRGDVLDALGVDFHLNHEQLGVLLSPAFWGFTLSILIGGSMVDYLGMRRLLVLSSLGYMVAPLLIIFAPRPTAAVTPYYTEPGFILLYTGMLMLGLCQGLVEGVINPLTATVYSDDKTHRLNVLHAWWPGGLIIGGLISLALGHFGAAWQVKMAVVLLPALIYGGLVLGTKFPPTERVAAGVPARQMVKELARPLVF